MCVTLDPFLSTASLPPVSTADRIVFKYDNMGDEMKEQVKYTFFLIETNGTIDDICGYLKERFENLYQSHKWTCVEGVEKVTRDDDEPPFGLFEYLPPGLGFSFKGVYLSYDGSLKSATNYLLLSRPLIIKPSEPEPKLIHEEQFKTFIFNSPYFLAIFMSIVASLLMWKKPNLDQVTNAPQSN